MTCHVHAFDGRERGTFRISLTYDTPTGSRSGYALEAVSAMPLERLGARVKPRLRR